MKNKTSTFFALILKSPKLLKLFKILKLMKFAKPMVTIITIAISILAYSIVYSPWIAVGLVTLIFVHEMGHVIAMNRLGFKTSGPVFIPFLGAALFAPRDMTRKQEAILGIGGPLLGSLFAFLVAGIAYLTHSKELMMIGYLGIFINLFNMVPISPLDSGRVTQAVGKFFPIIGFLILIGVTLAFKSPGILLIWILVLFDFTFMKVQLRFFFALIVELAMIFMLTQGIGISDDGQFWSVFADVIIGGLYLLLIGASIASDAKKTEEVFLKAQTAKLLHLKKNCSGFLHG
ncbi:MAG: site-2 protease family protein [bacterium]